MPYAGHSLGCSLTYVRTYVVGNSYFEYTNCDSQSVRLTIILIKSTAGSHIIIQGSFPRSD